MGRSLKVTLIAACSLFGLAVASAEGDCEPEAACVLDAVWSAALILPEDKKARVQPLFVETAALADPALMQNWADRFALEPVKAEPVDRETEFGWRHASTVLAEEGLDGLLQAAREKRAPLNFGRAEILFSAGERLIHKAPQDALRVNTALISLAGSASSFEKPSLAHAALELAMLRCDRALFADILPLTDNPLSLRYALWRARLRGNALSLLQRIRDEADDQDTRHVRQALSGYRAILEHGYCATANVDVVD
ncbi:MAG: hypothetical protein AAFZ91_02760 [Pseudomonadota bacterium]